MTFTEARAKQLQKLKTAFDALYAVVSDPLWCNPDYEKFVSANDNIDRAINQLQVINEAEVIAERDFE